MAHKKKKSGSILVKQKQKEKGETSIAQGKLNESDTVEAIDDQSDQENQISGSDSKDPKSHTLGEDDSFSLAGDSEEESVKGVDVDGSKEQEKGKSGTSKGSWVNLFADNRNPSMGAELDEIPYERDEIIFSKEDAAKSFANVKHNLVGYFSGRFPGRRAFKEITDAWGVSVTINFHNSGWIIFRFDNMEDKQYVLGNGPYLAYGRPLLLKAMPRYFHFENEAISTLPVLVMFKNLPLELWTPKVLSMLGSRLGKPVTTDKLTFSKERLSYARILVEIDIAKPLKKHLDIIFPDGSAIKQQIVYEKLPKFCSGCKCIGHLTSECRFATNKAPNGQAQDNQVKASLDIVPKVANLEGSTGVQNTEGNQSGKKQQQETKGTDVLLVSTESTEVSKKAMAGKQHNKETNKENTKTGTAVGKSQPPSAEAKGKAVIKPQWKAPNTGSFITGNVGGQSVGKKDRREAKEKEASNPKDETGRRASQSGL